MILRLCVGGAREVTGKKEDEQRDGQFVPVCVVGGGSTGTNRMRSGGARLSEPEQINMSKVVTVSSVKEGRQGGRCWWLLEDVLGVWARRLPTTFWDHM